MGEAEKIAGEFIGLIKESGCAAVLTGAGVSTGSGIPDFRSTGGLFSKISQRTFEIDFFYHDPLAYYKIAVEHIHSLADKKPNVTHEMLAELESRHMIAGVVTQNIDRLHQKAGSVNVLEFHGDVVSFHCDRCSKGFDRGYVEAYIRSEKTPVCDSCGSLVRPGIVFYGDMINEDVLQKSYDLAAGADLFIAMGSSLNVNPAASLGTVAVGNDARLVIINLGETPYDSMAYRRWPVKLEEFSLSVLNLIR